MSPRFIKAQIDAVFSQFSIAAVKIGMVWKRGVIEEIETALVDAALDNVVLDPVFAASSGRALLAEDAREPLKQRLFPRALLLTPNVFEAAVFTGSRSLAQTEDEMRAQGELLLALGPKAVLVKGGHATGACSVDVLVEPGGVTRFPAQRIPGRGMRGTGCALSSAIAAELAKGFGLHDAVGAAKAYVTAAIAAA